LRVLSNHVGNFICADVFGLPAKCVAETINEENAAVMVLSHHVA
jgi:hypothetical protein